MASEKNSKAPPPLGNVLVTGSSGFLGSHILEILAQRYGERPDGGTTLNGFDIKPIYTDSKSPRSSNIRYTTGDISSQEDVARCLKQVQPDVIIHTVSPVASHDAKSKKGRDFIHKINVEGTRTLLEEAKKHNVRAFVYTSSASVISDCVTDLVNANEEWEVIKEPAQREYYSHTKAEAESLVLSHNTRVPPIGSPCPHFLTCAIRPASIFGERDVQMIPPMLEVVRSGRTGVQLGDGNNLFDFTYVGNVAEAHILAAGKLLEASERLKAGGEAGAGELPKGGENNVDGEAFFITNQSPIYFWDFARMVWNTYDRVSGGAYKRPVPAQKVWVLSRNMALAISYLLVFLIGPLMALFGKSAPSLTPTRVRYACMTRYYRTRKAEERLGYMAYVSIQRGIERSVKYFWEREQEEQAVKAAKKSQ